MSKPKIAKHRDIAREIRIRKIIDKTVSLKFRFKMGLARKIRKKLRKVTYDFKMKVRKIFQGF